MNRFLLLSITLGMAIAGPAQAQLKFNPNQVAILRWYQANQTAFFSVGLYLGGMVFDGANIWVTNNEGNGTVTKLRTSDGANLGTFAVGNSPRAVAFDGTNIWVANSATATISIL